ncbi:MAG: outer membrane beta-barrel protein [Deltaproteobacteria bacterium]|nr:outer membrane beta-barrel protein [Deltaproteobacteria bacterium]
MKATRMIAAAVLVLSGLIAPSQASAQGAFYIGGSAGKSDFGSDGANGRITAGTVDATDTGFKIFGGYQSDKNSAVEIAYVDLGRARYSGSSRGNLVTDGKFEIRGINISGVGILDLHPSFAVLLKTGLFGWETKTSDVANGVPFSEKGSFVLLSFGFGLSYKFTKHVSMRAEWEWFWVGVAAPTLLSIGIAREF